MCVCRCICIAVCVCVCVASPSPRRSSHAEIFEIFFFRTAAALAGNVSTPPRGLFGKTCRCVFLQFPLELKVCASSRSSLLTAHLKSSESRSLRASNHRQSHVDRYRLAATHVFRSSEFSKKFRVDEERCPQTGSGVF